jgi:hypothetical protein
MGFLNKVFGGGTRLEERPEAEVAEAVCPHTALAPHWDSLDDMGKNELATYTCESCGRTFPYDEARLLMEQPPEALLAANAPEDDIGR